MSTSARVRPGPEEHRWLTLPDGRRLSYAEYGDPAGVPILSFHGGMSSRLDAAPTHRAALGLGIRVVSPDRPGMGRSDYQDRRSLLHWPTDVVALTDALGIGRFSVLGWSCGGPYAAVCGAKMPERVAAGALLSSSVPFEAYGTRRGLTSDDRFLLVLCRWAPQLASAVLHVSVRRASPERLRAVVSRDMTEADMASLDAVGPPEVSLDFIRESMRHGPRGSVHDYRVFGDPWGFRLDEIGVPMHIWEGAEDRTGPVGYRELLRRHIPRSTLTVVPGEGHISLLRNHAEAILGPLAAALR